jgi:hypothetical protein
MTIPDFGMHQKDGLECKYIAPGLTLHDLVGIYENAQEGKDDLSGNPGKWGVVRGVNAVTEAVLAAVYNERT